MKLTMLMDNHTEIDVYYLGEPAVSYWIETDGKRFLFDTGYSDAFLKNAAAMGLDLTTADTVLLSHSHNDHTGGLRPFAALDFPRKLPLLAHPDALLPHDKDGEDIGCPLSMARLGEKFDLRLTKEPVWLTKKLVWLGEIPRTQPFEPVYTIGTVQRESGAEPDTMRDDTALAYVGEKGLSVISACSHSGICNIISYAKKVTGIEKVQSVLGGFHLFALDDRAKATIDFLTKENIPELCPCHCTSFAVRAALHAKAPVREVAVGTVFNWD